MNNKILLFISPWVRCGGPVFRQCSQSISQVRGKRASTYLDLGGSAHHPAKDQDSDSQPSKSASIGAKAISSPAPRKVKAGDLPSCCKLNMNEPSRLR